uniref:CDP-diacylglycerol--glycerol-3-phosphate 3-phosphatidyltransferase n=1 Tax=Timema douglasi TaxID=61478 RepID=A0A7R8VEE9_TIMDO|nr:unnamed protein product [Timema douglasi]
MSVYTHKMSLSTVINSPVFTWLRSKAPGFSLNGNKVSVISEPSVFYETLLNQCLSSKQRITLVSLYLGTGALEEKLVSSIHQNLKESNGAVRVKILLDYTRGSRGSHNSRTMLLPLLDKYQKSCQVCLYHTPTLREPLRSLLPQRYNELAGLQHMKLYLFDDSIIISGANLSKDYFTNRQDRYVLIEDCKPLADFYDALVSRVCDFSLHLDKANQVQLHERWDIHPYKGDKERFTAAARQHMGELGLHQDSEVTRHLLESAQDGSTVHLSSGYFNLTQDYIDCLLHRSSANYHILMAHPTVRNKPLFFIQALGPLFSLGSSVIPLVQANGFYEAKGLAGGIPAAYTLLATKFLGHIRRADQESRVFVYEFQRPGWTFHSKGLWYSPPGSMLPTLTLVGSSNFGARSVSRDLETQVAILTSNPKLQQDFANERDQLFSRGTLFTQNIISKPERIVPFWVHGVARLFRNYF